MKKRQNYRRFSRYPIRVGFRLHKSENTTDGKLLFDSLNMSAGGAFLRSALLFEVGTQIEVSFNLPNRAQPINTKAEITWVTRRSTKQHERGMGIKFLQLDDVNLEEIEELLQSFSTLPH